MLKFILSLVFFFSPLALKAQTIWTEQSIQFHKSGTPLDIENQDRITNNVWITRGLAAGIYNIAEESQYTSNLSPSGTRWAFAELNGNPANISATDYQNLNFTSWQQALGGPGQLQGNIFNRPGVVHLQADDIYIDIRFTEWSQGSTFSYIRASAPEQEEDIPFPPIWLALMAVLIGLVGQRIKRKGL